VLATKDYPARSSPLRDLPSNVMLAPGRVAFWGGSSVRNGAVDASGGRVLTVTATGRDIEAARESAYGAVRELTARTAQETEFRFRSDIAARV
jgi:phosphoribosylamine--glycine ligase